MTYTFFNQKCDNGVNDTLSWFFIYLMFSFQDITQNMFCNMAKISHPADLEICYFNWKLANELYWLHVECVLRNVLLKIASQSTYRNIIEFLGIFNAILRLIWAKCYLKNRWLNCIQTWRDKLLHAADWFSAIIIFHGPNSLTTSYRCHHCYQCVVDKC